MDKEIDPQSKEKHLETISDFFKNISPDSIGIQYLKKFFYQIIGIYLPSTILIFYILLFYFSILLPNKEIHNFVLQMYNSGIFPRPFFDIVLLVISIVIVGEGINSITTWIAPLSPIKKKPWKEQLTEAIEFAFKQKTIKGISEKAKWPIWLNDTGFPVSFSNFDRYYISVLEQEKKSLAGKIGWVSFYRNMIAVFVIIFVMHLTFFVIDAYLHIFYFKVFLNELIPDLNHEFILIIIFILIFFLVLGYFSQLESNRSYLWDAYRRYELGKDLYAKHGDLILSLDIQEDKKQKVMEYILDKWILAVDHTLKSTSSKLLAKAERIYFYTFSMPIDNCLHKDKNNEKKNSELKELDEIKQIKQQFVETYAYWYNGNYQQVFHNVLNLMEKKYELSVWDKILCFIVARDWPKNIRALEKCKQLQPLQQRVTQKYEKIKTRKIIYDNWNCNASKLWNKDKEIEWKIIRGHYQFEKESRLDDTWNKIKKEIDERKWSNKNNNVNNKIRVILNKRNTKGKCISEQSDNERVADLIWESVDEYFRSYNAISKLFQCICKIKKDKNNFFLSSKINIQVKDNENYSKEQEYNLLKTQILYYDKIYKSFIDKKLSEKSDKTKVKEEQLYKELCIKDILEYIYYLFGNYEYSEAAKESTYLYKYIRNNKFCIECGLKLNLKSKLCTSCGTKQVES